MKLRLVALSLLILLVCCSCGKKEEQKRKMIPATVVINLTMDPSHPGQCLQTAGPPSGPFTPYPQFVPVRGGDNVKWATNSAIGGANAVFFPTVSSPNFPGTPMFSRAAGNWVRAFAYGNNPLANAATLTQAEEPSFDFPYSQVLVPDPNNGQLTACQYPDPGQGMGVHVQD